MLAGCMHAYYARVVGGQLGALSCKMQPDISRSFRRMLCVCEDKREVAGAEANTLWRFEDLWQSQKGHQLRVKLKSRYFAVHRSEANGRSTEV
jgi:hypothetical protein